MILVWVLSRVRLVISLGSVPGQTDDISLGSVPGQTDDISLGSVPGQTGDLSGFRPGSD